MSLLILLFTAVCSSGSHHFYFGVVFLFLFFFSPGNRTRRLFWGCAGVREHKTPSQAQGGRGQAASLEATARRAAPLRRSLGSALGSLHLAVVGQGSEGRI